MVNSMTGFAARRGRSAAAEWAWDLRSVNGKGFDLRHRGIDGVEGLEALVRTELARGIQRGNLTLTLKLVRAAGDEPQRLNAGVLAGVLAALRAVEDAAVEADLRLAPSTGADLLALRGVLEAGSAEPEAGGLLADLAADLKPLIADFQAMRAAEGRALGGIIAAQVAQIAVLTTEARRLADARRANTSAWLRSNLARVLDNAEGADPDRVAQELAILAVKSDVTEELDRLDAHLAAAQAHLADPGPVGRKLDFLMQEFLREANTLCSKSTSADLTRVGLDLKLVIDQMREQVQNVE